MDQAHLDNAFGAIGRFLDSRAPFLYGRNRIRFRKSSHYVHFDAMLKREIAYCKYEAGAMACECRSKTIGMGFAIRIEQGPVAFPAADTAVAEPFQAFLVRRGFLLRNPDRTFQITLPEFEGNVILAQESPVVFSLHASSMQPRSLKSSLAEVGSLEADISHWLASALEGWITEVPGHLTESTQDVSPDGITNVLTAWMPISTIDIDISGEDIPDVFRWQENTRLARAVFADLSETECLDVLKENRTAPPGEARLLGITRFEVEEGIACIALRYAHVLPDLESNPGIEEDLPLRNRGFILAEGDFWEFHIDAKDRLLIGEYRKWRRL